MAFQLQQSEFFLSDVELQFRWYLQAGGPDLARHYRVAVQATLVNLLKQPESGRLRFPNDHELHGIRSCQLLKPFHRHLLFYRLVDNLITLERTIHGARDLSRRIKEPPAIS